MALRVGRCLLARYRRKAGLTQIQLAEELGVTQSFISQLENMVDGIVMTYEFALNASVILKCKMEDFYTQIKY